MTSHVRVIERALEVAAANDHQAWVTLNQHAVVLGTIGACALVLADRMLEGLPCGIKDNIDVAGLPTGSGSAYTSATATRDADVVRALRDAGAAIIGKNAMHEVAYGATGMVSATEPAQNPRAAGRIPGGSSSGSAAAVAAGDVPFAIGTDTGGSVRVPAACCGVVGLRPTTGTLSSAGVRPLSPTLDTIGVLAASVDIAAVVWCAVSGTAPPPPGPDAPRRVGVVVDAHFAPSSPAIAEAVRSATALLERHGSTVRPVQLGWGEAALSIYTHIVGVEAARGHRDRLSERSPLFQPSTYQRLTASGRISRQAYDEALRRRVQIADDLLRLFDHHDVLICPTTPITAPKRGQATADVGGRTIEVGQALVAYTAPWSVTGAPALAVPVSCDPHGLPTSIQILGRPGDEIGVLNTGLVIER